MLSRMAPSSPPAKRTYHLLKTPDILCANDTASWDIWTREGILKYGAILLARAVLNTPLKRMIGADETAGLRIQKTVFINASAADLYQFWKNPENYPKVFAHVKQITPEQNGIFLWQVLGPAGIPLTWRGRITRLIPEKRIEWWSLPDSVIENHGVIHLESAEGRPKKPGLRAPYSGTTSIALMVA